MQTNTVYILQTQILCDTLLILKRLDHSDRY